jgi:hypothetical protein
LTNDGLYLHRIVGSGNILKDASNATLDMNMIHPIAENQTYGPSFILTEDATHMYPIPSSKRCQIIRSSPSCNIGYLYTGLIQLAFPQKKTRTPQGEIKDVDHFKAVVAAGKNPDRTVLLLSCNNMSRGIPVPGLSRHEGLLPENRSTEEILSAD